MSSSVLWKQWLSIASSQTGAKTQNLITLNLFPGTPFLCFTRDRKRIRKLSVATPVPDLWREVEFPEVTHNSQDYLDARRLPEMPKIPVYTDWHRPSKPPKHPRNLVNIRGPELVHNKLEHQQFGVVAEQGGFLREEHFSLMKTVTDRHLDFKRMFAQYRVDPLWQSWTKKPVGAKMGGGKGSVHHYVTPIKAGRVILEVGGHCTYEEVYKTLRHIAHVMPFAAKAVSYEEMVNDEEREKTLELANINPFTMDYCIKYNMMGCWRQTKYFDYIWKMKYGQ